MFRTPTPFSSNVVRQARRLWRQFGIFWLGAIAVGLVGGFVNVAIRRPAAQPA